MTEKLRDWTGLVVEHVATMTNATIGTLLRFG